MYKDYIFKTKNNPKKSIPKITLKVLKILIFSFLFLSMLWGCSEMMVSKYRSYQVVDSSGESTFKSGIFFEILFSNHGLLNKLHYGHTKSGNIYEYSYLSIDSWGDAFKETQSPFYGFFVYPTSWLLITIMYGFGGPDYWYAILLSIFLMSLFVKSITIAFTWKTQMNQEKTQMLQIKQQSIKNKYAANKNDPAIKRKQQMEIMDLYKKNNISPISSIGTTFLSMPFLFSLYVTIRATRILKTASIGHISLIDRPWSMITGGEPIYLVLLIVLLPIQITSMFLPVILGLKNQINKTPEQKKAVRRQFIMLTVMLIFFTLAAINIASGVAIYWIFSGFLQICQTLLFHYGKIWHRNKGQRIKRKVKQIKVEEMSKKQITSFDKSDTYNDSNKPNINNNQKNKTKQKPKNNPKRSKKTKYTL